MCKDHSGLTLSPKTRPVFFIVLAVINLGECADPLAATILPMMNITNLLHDRNIAELMNITKDMKSSHEDVKLPVGDLIVKYGYPMEKHQVVTEDGYILSMIRVPGNGPAVLLMHGLLGSADDFVIAGASSGLAYRLSDEGYDVWMGNARGNKYSRRHQKLKPTAAAFWDFSWHEIGSRDLPAMIDYTLNVTKQDTLKYIGHSQGTTVCFVLLSEKPEYNRKVSAMIALSPVAFMSHITSPFVRMLAPLTRFIYKLAKSRGAYEMLSDSSTMRNFKETMCSRSQAAELLCSNLLFILCGFSVKQLNVTNLPVIYGHVPSGASIKQFAHYGQSIMSGKFRKFDYGSSKNKKLYSSEVPSSYDLKQVMVPVSLIYSDSDWFSNPKDVKKLYRRLGNPVNMYKVPYQPFNHLDFIWALDFNTLIYTKLKNILLTDS